MIVLGIDTSTNTASVSIINDEKILSLLTSEGKLTHSSTILPMIDNALKSSNIEIKNLDGIAVNIGPGSFTGLRIGLSVAYGISFPYNIPIIPVDTLESYAYNYLYFKGIICPMIDARRENVYTGLYKSKKDTVDIIKESFAVNIYDLIDILSGQTEEVILTGDGAFKNEDVLKERLKVNYSFASSLYSRNNAANVAYIGMNKLKNNEIIPNENIKIRYLRPTRAERYKNK